MVKYCRPVRLLSIFLMLSAAALPHLASAEEGPANLTLRQAIKMAVEKNLDVKAELYNSASAEADLRGKEGI
ncbi:MAG: TolC family protein, partial [Deltaproteobacteria bacterium]